MFTDTYWWPLELSPEEEEAVRNFRDTMLATGSRVNLSRLRHAADLLSVLMRQHLADVIDRDGLPHLCHVINGWGNARFRGRRLVEGFTNFLHRDRAGVPFILQRDPEGEFHPWQSFAYAVMAGVGPDEPISSRGVTLRSLAHSSRTLNTPNGHELGHLLFALAYLDPTLGGPPFRLKGGEHSAGELVERAVHAHHYGSFEVCRKFHLTEGICAMAARVSGLAHVREAAQGFLDGQLDILFVLGAILQEVSRLVASGDQAATQGRLTRLRDALVLGPFIENHFYYAGHLIELAAFAAIQEYRITPAHWNAMAYIVNELNTVLPTVATRLSFLGCFLHFGHYRRAITLLEAIRCSEETSCSGVFLRLAEYTVDFDQMGGRPPWPDAALEDRCVAALRFFEVESPSGNPRSRFLEVVGSYAAAARPGLEPRGKYDHFRRIGPPSWPRAFHYEFLDYGDSIGVEIHLESDAVLQLREPVRAFADGLRATFAPLAPEWDPTWWKERGRLRVLFEDSHPPETVAAGMNSLIRETFTSLDQLASALSVTAF